MYYMYKKLNFWQIKKMGKENDFKKYLEVFSYTWTWTAELLPFCWFDFGYKPESLFSVLHGQRDQNVVLGQFIAVASHIIWRWTISSKLMDSMTQIQGQANTVSTYMELSLCTR